MYLVTGCNGQLGHEIMARLPNAIATDADALDITNFDAVQKFVRENNIDTIINCAAYTAVDRAESDIDLATRVNVNGPENLAKTGCKLIHISTDYVFPGDVSDHPLTEFDQVKPKSMYGATKLAGENFVRDFADRYFMIRTAWLYGDGHNFAKTMLKLSETNDTIGVVMDQVGTPTSAAELAKAVKYLLPTDNYGLFHGTCEGDTNWAEFAATVLKLAGKKTVIEPITSQEYKRRFPASADRPAYSILENYMLKLTTDFSFAPWQDAIEIYMKELLGQ